MRNNNLDCSTNMQWSSKNLATQWIRSYPCKTKSVQAELKSRVIYAAQVRNKWTCRTSCTTKERRNFVSIDSVWTARKLVGRSHGVSLLSPKMCKTHWQMARRPMNVGSIHHLQGRAFLLEEQKLYSIQYHQQTQGRCISSAQKSFLENSFVRLECGWKLDWWSFDGGNDDLRTIPPSENSCKNILIKEVQILKRNDELVCTCKTGEILRG